MPDFLVGARSYITKLKKIAGGEGERRLRCTWGKAHAAGRYVGWGSAEPCA